MLMNLIFLRLARYLRIKKASVGFVLLDLVTVLRILNHKLIIKIIILPFQVLLNLTKNYKTDYPLLISC